MGTRIEWREERPCFSSLSEQFRSAGWQTVGFGKIFDNRLGMDVGPSWDAFTQGWKAQYADNTTEKAKGLRPAVECAEVSDDQYTDGHLAQLAVDFVDRYDGQKPFFLAVGFSKPHLPFVAPKRYWDLYDREQLEFPVGTGPTDYTAYTFSTYKELFSYAVERPVSEAQARELIHGYYACISYVDAQLDRVIKALEEKNLLDNTLIVLWGDHGFKLGEYGEWAKNTNLEIDTRVPLIISLPKNREMARGAKSFSLVELVDLFPTMCEVAGLPVPATVEGRSLVPVLKAPKATVRSFALSQFPHEDCLGYSIRTDGWRYTEWRNLKSGAIQAQELYDLRTASIETENVYASQPEQAAFHAELLREYLSKAIQWDGEIIW